MVSRLQYVDASSIPASLPQPKTPASDPTRTLMSQEGTQQPSATKNDDDDAKHLQNEMAKSVVMLEVRCPFRGDHLCTLMCIPVVAFGQNGRQRIE